MALVLELVSYLVRLTSVGNLCEKVVSDQTKERYLSQSVFIWGILSLF